MADDREKPDDLVTVDSFVNVYEADTARLYLEQEGIPVFLKDFNIVAFDWFLSNAVGNIQVQVRRDDLERAAAILAEHRPSFNVDYGNTKSPAKSTLEMKCLSCGEPMGAQATRCAKCGWSYEQDDAASEE